MVEGDHLALHSRRASTEPRPRGRGWHSVPLANAAMLALQRSPDLAVGDGELSFPARGCYVRLQRSPDLAVGDGSATPDRPPAPPRFNGAPTSRSGMDVPRRARGVAGGASTEPRPRGRGWLPPPPPGPLEREASTEPRPRGRGWRVAPARGGAPPLASTEPRPRGRGWQAGPVPRGLSRRASTEPRPRGRGWLVGWFPLAPPPTLQRSPDLAVGDGRAVAPGFVASGQLQRSPDLAVGDGTAAMIRTTRLT